MNNLKLCYVENNVAFFTSKGLNGHRNVGWHKGNYTDNADPPRKYDPEFDSECEEWEILIVPFYAPRLSTPCETGSPFYRDSRWSVDEINKGHVAWLATDVYSMNDEKIVRIWPGTSPEEFRKIIREIGGVSA